MPLLGEAFDAITQIDDLQTRAQMLVKLVSAPDRVSTLDRRHVERIKAAADEFEAQSVKIEILAAFPASGSNEVSIVQEVRESLPVALREFTEDTFDVVITFCPIRTVFRPPAVTPEACAFAAREIYHVTQRWRWP
jgi:GTP1/Obg family GTP-binding protein